MPPAAGMLAGGAGKMDAGMNRPSNEVALELRIWSEGEFAASRHAWGDLLRRSGADPLFMSWDWQWSWWLHHKEALGAQLLLLAAYDGAGTLRALAPVYCHRRSYFSALPVMRMCLIGQSWRDSSTVFSEYLDFIVDRDVEAQALSALGAWFQADRSWDELVFPAVKMTGFLPRLVREQLANRNLVREVDLVDAYCLTLSPDFKQFLDQLKPGARRKIYNQRKKLTGVSRAFATESELPQVFASLNQFRSSRWESNEESHKQDFHLGFAKRMADDGALKVSTLVHEGRIVSVMYNVRRDGTEYFLQSGFDTEALPGISVGYIHLGHCIEDAGASGEQRFDFLCGRGKNRNYKQDFNADRLTLASFHVVRARSLRLLLAGRRVAARLRALRRKPPAGHSFAVVAPDVD